MFSLKINKLAEMFMTLLVINLQPILGCISATLAIMYYYVIHKEKMENNFDGSWGKYLKNYFKIKKRKK